MRTAAFVSYSRADSEFALRLGSDLKAAGTDVWLDQLEIGAGQRWDSAVEDALSQCARVVVLLSPDAVTSPHVLDEVSYALEEGKKLIPVLVRDCKVPLRLRRLHRIDFRADYAKALRALTASLSDGDGINDRKDIRHVSLGALPAPQRHWGGWGLRSLLSLFSHDLAISLGTQETLIYARGRGIVLIEPSIVAINKTNGRVEAVGKDAKAMLGEKPGHIVAIRPMKDGVVADFDVAARMLRYFITKAHDGSFWARPRVVITVPTGVTQVERHAVRDSAWQAKASEVHLVGETMAAAIGSGLPITEPSASMIVDVGHHRTEVAVIADARIVHSETVRVGDTAMVDAIIEHIRKAHNVLIGERTAAAIRNELGSAWPLEERMTMAITGRHLIQGTRTTVTINDEEIHQALAEPVTTIVATARRVLTLTPHEFAVDLVDRGIVLTGVGALLRDLDKSLRAETELPVSVSEDPVSAALLGAGKLLSDFNLLRRIAMA